MITRFHIENFKSLADFDLPPKGHDLGAFTCLIGMNGAGKTTLLQAFDFIAQLMAGRVESWLLWREWEKMDLVTNLGGKKPMVIQLTVELLVDDGSRAQWSARYHAPLMRCTAETVMLGGDVVLNLQDGRLHVVGPSGTEPQRFDKVPFEYNGSVLSTLNLEHAHPLLKQVKQRLCSLHSLELLAPQLLRKRSRESEDIGPGGERLSGFLAQLDHEQRSELLVRLQKFYPQIKNWRIKSKRFGWKGLLVGERPMGSNEVNEAHINDGFLRVIAILSQAYAHAGVLLLDEIENGINPAVADELVDFLVALSKGGRQVIVTTHSPVILNYLDDEVAREAVILLFKTPDGRTHCRRYFDIPENDKKLSALGPGEVFLDTSIERLVERLAKEESQHMAPA